MNEIAIRQCNQDDIDNIIGMESRWAQEGITYGLVPSEREQLQGYIGPYFLVAEAKGITVGFIYGSIKVSEEWAIMNEGQRYLRIDGIYVSPEFRNRGIGGALLNRLIETAEGDGIQRSLVYSATRELDVILRFYRRHGFKSWYVQMFR
jgi:GNAT superfamily N-acetyltransferase